VEQGPLARIGYFHIWDNKWSKPKLIDVESGDGNCWHPAISAGPNGEVAVAFDVYRNGSLTSMSPSFLATSKNSAVSPIPRVPGATVDLL